jgi:peptidylprolyl isomerase
MQASRSSVLALLCLFAGCVTNPYAPPPDVAAPPADATRLPSGLAYRVLRPGSGSEHPALSDTITVNYTGWTQDGHKFDSTAAPDGAKAPVSFPLGKLIKGWQEAVPLMMVGETLRVWIPSEMAYGDHPTRADHPPAGPLVFDIELVSIQH